jgi:hypothetical protein
MRAKLQRLLEGHPDRRCVALLDRFRPQHQDIDTAVGDAVAAQGPRDAAGGMPGVSQFEPGADALLEVRDDGVGDALIDIASHCRSFLGFRVRVNRLATRQWSGGGLAVTGQKTKQVLVRAGAASAATTRPAVFRPEGLALTAGGQRAPSSNRME